METDVKGPPNVPKIYNYGKQNEKLWLADATMNDAEHDISLLTQYFRGPQQKSQVLNAFLSGIPSHGLAVQKIGSEWDVLNSVLYSSGGPDNERIDTPFQQLIEGGGIPDVTQGQQIPLPLRIGIPTNPQLKPQTGSFEFARNYTAVSFTIKSDTNIKQGLTPTPSGANIGELFCQNTELFGSSSKAIFVVDFNQHGFLSQLKMGLATEAGADKSIYIVTTPEVINDPASKPRFDDKLLYFNTSGINLVSLVQKDPEDTFYTPFDERDESSNNNFFSKMEFILSPLLSNTTKKSTRLYTNVNIGYRPGGVDSFFINLPDSKYGNSNEEVSAKIRKICQNIPIGGSNKDDFEFNLNVQRKRAGDWWQALCCLMIYTRVFVDVFGPSNRPPVNLTPDVPCYFVTHDKIAASYALAMGCNVIFIDNFGRVIVLKNMEDLAFINQDGKRVDPNIAILAKLKAKMFDENDAFAELLAEIEVYNKKQFELLVRLDAELRGAIDLFEKNQFDIPTGNFDSIQNIFRAAVKLSFALKSLPNIRNDYDIVTKSMEEVRKLIEQGITPDKSVFLTNYNRSYNSLCSVKRLLDNIPVPPDVVSLDVLVSAKLNLFVDKIERQRVYTSISSLFTGTDENTVDFRSLNSQGTPEFYPEKHSFLSFIQNIPYDLRRQILESINGTLTAVTIGHSATLTDGKKTRRGVNVSQNIRVNNIFNFILEARYLLYVPPPSKEKVDDLVAKRDIAQQEVGDQEEIKRLTDELGSEMGQMREQEKDVNSVKAPPEAPFETSLCVSDTTAEILINSDFIDISILNSKIGSLKPTLGSLDEETSSDEDNYSEDEGNKRDTSKFSEPSSPPREKKRQDTTNTDDASMEPTQEPVESFGPLDINVEVQENPRTTRYSLMTGLLTNTQVYYTNFNSLFTEQQRGGGLGLEDKFFEEGIAQKDFVIPNLEKMLDGPPPGGSANISNVNFGYHPLLPLYMILSAFWYSIGPEIVDDAFFNSYTRYCNFLDVMITELIQISSVEPVKAFIIGFALKAFLFNPQCEDKFLGYGVRYDYFEDINNIFQPNGIKFDTDYDYRMMLLINSALSNYVSGNIYVTANEYNFEKQLLNLDFVKSFITRNYLTTHPSPPPGGPPPPPPGGPPPGGPGDDGSGSPPPDEAGDLTPPGNTPRSPDSPIGATPSQNLSQYQFTPESQGSQGSVLRATPYELLDVNNPNFVSLHNRIFNLLDMVHNGVRQNTPGPNLFSPDSQGYAADSAASSAASSVARPLATTERSPAVSPFVSSRRLFTPSPKKNNNGMKDGGKRKTQKRKHRKTTQTKRKQIKKGIKKTRKLRKIGNKNKSKKR